MPPMPMNGAAPPAMPPMPTPEQLEQDKLIAEACSWEEVSGILRSDDRRNYSIDIETDATAFEDEEAEKAQSIEYVKAMTEMMQLWIPAIQGNPTLAPFAKELAVFVSSRFKPGRQFEEQLGDAFDQIQNTPPQPNPEAEAAKAEMAMKQQEAQASAQAQQADMAFKQQDAQLKVKQAESEFAMKQQQLAAELEFKRAELGIKMQELSFKKESAAFDMGVKQQDVAMRIDEAQANRASQDDDRQFQRQVALEDIQGKRQDRELKTHETQSRLAMDRDEQQARRSLEGEQMKGEGGKTAKAEIEDSVAQQITELASQFAASMRELSANQVQIVSVLQEIRGNQDEMTDAVTAVVGHMTAPRKVSRDPKTGRAMGVEIGQSDGDLPTMLARLKSGKRGIARGADGRVEGMA